MDYGVELMRLEERLNGVFVAHIGARELTTCRTSELPGARLVVIIVGDDRVIGLAQSRDEGASQNAGAAGDENGGRPGHERSAV